MDKFEEYNVHFKVTFDSLIFIRCLIFAFKGKENH